MAGGTSASLEGEGVEGIFLSFHAPRLPYRPNLGGCPFLGTTTGMGIVVLSQLASHRSGTLSPDRLGRGGISPKVGVEGRRDVSGNIRLFVGQ